MELLEKYSQSYRISKTVSELRSVRRAAGLNARVREPRSAAGAGGPRARPRGQACRTPAAGEPLPRDGGQESSFLHRGLIVIIKVKCHHGPERRRVSSACEHTRD